jgi:hypothetical protein
MQFRAMLHWKVVDEMKSIRAHSWRFLRQFKDLE